jgi:hypothetical protein
MAFLKPFYMHLLPWDENKFIAKAYQKKRPTWIIIVALLGLGVVAFTWYKELTTDVAYSWVMSLIFSLTAIKALLFLFDYERFQTWVAAMLAKDKGKKIIWIDVFVGIFGLLIMVITYLLYGE